MLFGHLFGPSSNIGQYVDIASIGNLPLAHILSRATSPVAFFVFLGGYGLYCVYEKGHDEHRWSRIWKLYYHYWLILAIFVPLAYIVRNRVYLTDFATIAANVIGYGCTWNYESWFLLPYSLVSLSSPCLFKMMLRFRARYIVVACYTSFLAMATAIHFFHATYLSEYPLLSLAVVYFEFMGAFGFGAMARRTRFFETLRTWKQEKNVPNWAWMLALVLLVVTKCIFASAAWDPIYAAVFITLFISISRYGWVDKILALLGKHSMNMWLIHTWFSNYIFHDFIFGFKYPLLIYVALIIISLCCSVIINLIVQGVKQAAHSS